MVGWVASCTRMAVEPILGIGKVMVSFDPLLLPACPSEVRSPAVGLLVCDEVYTGRFIDIVISCKPTGPLIITQDRSVVAGA